MAAAHKFGPTLEHLADPRYIVLTVENCPLKELARGLDELSSAFERLRHSKLWVKVRGAVAVLEITYNEAAQAWHPHLNVLLDGPFIVKADLDAVWLRSTRGKGQITWIERADRQTLFELMKYVTKLSDFVHIPEAVEWFLIATHGRRFIRTYGSLYRLKPAELDGEAETIEKAEASCPDCRCRQVQELPLVLGIDDVFFDGNGVLRCCIPPDDPTEAQGGSAAPATG